MSHRRKLFIEAHEKKLNNSECGDTPAHDSEYKESNVFEDVKTEEFNIVNTEIVESDKAVELNQVASATDDVDKSTASEPDVDNELTNNDPENNSTQDTMQLRCMLNEFQDICNSQMDRIAEFAVAFNIDPGCHVHEEKSIKLRKKKYSSKQKPQIIRNLMIICLIFVLLMQIHMYILLYSKLIRLESDVQEISCVVYGKNCPNSRISYECLWNKIDFMDSEYMRSMNILQKDMEDVATAMINISELIYSTNKAESEDTSEINPPNMPPRTGSIYPVNP